MMSGGKLTLNEGADRGSVLQQPEAGRSPILNFLKDEQGKKCFYFLVHISNGHPIYPGLTYVTYR
jgi:hypothetical protein